MAISLYVIASATLILGISLIIPTAFRASQISDVVMLLGAPIITNGIFLCVCAVIISALGKITELLAVIAGKTDFIDVTSGDNRVFVKCPNCSQQLRVPSGKKGMLACPKCEFKFEAAT
jgi:uncharacterized Zn-finger protein